MSVGVRRREALTSAYIAPKQVCQLHSTQPLRFMPWPSGVLRAGKTLRVIVLITDVVSVNYVWPESAFIRCVRVMQTCSIFFARLCARRKGMARVMENIGRQVIPKIVR